jgi:tetratricopeptide (TPR) repeat protein
MKHISNKIFYLILLILFFHKHSLAFQIQDTTTVNLKLDSANSFYNKADYQKAIQLANEGAVVSEQIKYLKGTAWAHNILANVYLRQGNFSKANEEGLITLKTNEISKNQKGMYSSLLLLGNIFFSTNNYKKAKDYFKRALIIAKSIAYNKGMAKSSMNLGLVFNELNEKDSALNQIQLAITYFNMLKDSSSLGMAYSNVGVIYFDKKNWNLALKNYELASKIAFAKKDLHTLSGLKINIGSTLLELKKLSPAEKSVQDGLLIATEINAAPSIVEAHTILSNIYEKQGYYDKALASFKTASKLSDSISLAEQTLAIEETNAKFENEKKDRDIALLIKEKQMQQLEIVANTRKQSINRIVVAACTIVLGLIISIFLYVNKKKQIARLAYIENGRVKAELKGLKSQLNPHALFNSLNTIYFQMDEDIEAAKESILTYADILRYQLYKSNVDFIDLQTEIEYLKKFIDIQKLRLSERCQLNVSIDDTLNELTIAPLVIMTIVENAFKHVSNFKERSNFITISLTRLGSDIQLITENSIFHFNHQESVKIEGGGVGLSNLKQRLELIYPNKHKLEYFEKNEIFHVKLVIHAK